MLALVAVSGCAFKGLTAEQGRDRFAVSDDGRLVVYAEVTHLFDAKGNDEGCRDLIAGKFDQKRLDAGVTPAQLAEAKTICPMYGDGSWTFADGITYGKFSEMVRTYGFAKKDLGIEVGDIVRIEQKFGVLESGRVTRIAAKKKDRESSNCGWSGLKAMFTGGIVCRDEWDYREQPAFTGKRSNVVK